MRKFRVIILSVLLAAFVLGAFVPSPAQAASFWQLKEKSRLSVTAGEALSEGDAVYIKDADGYAYKADSDGSSTYPAVGLVENGIASGGDVLIVTKGILGGQSGLAEGATCYLSGTAGGITQTEVAAYPQPIGYAISTTQYQIDVRPYSPAIGAATGTSVTVSGAITGNSGVYSTVTASGAITGDSGVYSTVTASGAVTGNSFVGSTATISGDVTFGGGRVAVYCFENNNLASAQSAVAMNRNAGGTVTGIAMPYSGSILAVTVDSNTAITSGSFTGDPTVDGGATGLQGVLNVTDTTTDYAEQAKDTDTFTAGQILGVDYTTTGTFTPVTVDIGVCITVEY